MDSDKKRLLQAEPAGMDDPFDPGYPSRDGRRSTIVAIERGEADMGHLSLTWSDVSVHVPADASARPRRSLKDYFSSTKPGKAYTPVGPRHILKDVYGTVQSGQLLAIMGGSGAGKTTLLNVLTKRNTGTLQIEGSVRINGESVPASIMRSISAYVQQDGLPLLLLTYIAFNTANLSDLFIGTLKVREHLLFQALLRMDAAVPYADRVRKVDEVISELGLGKCENTLIGIPGRGGRLRGISGGERKRLAFAAEALTNPAILFCDEPTSGLDSFMAQQVVSVLKEMAQRGKIIVCTIHQPSSPVFALFDQLLLMAEGRVSYLGQAKAAAKLFESVGFACPSNFNPADHYIRTLAIVPGKERECRKRVRKLCEAYERSEAGVETKAITARAAEQRSSSDSSDSNAAVAEVSRARLAKRYKASWMTQFRVLLWRCILGNIREPLLIQVRLQQTLIVAVILGLIYWQTNIEAKTIMNVNGVLFLFITNMTFQFIFGVLNVFCEELPIFMREHLSGIYRVDTYYWSKNVAEIPQYVILPFLFTVILYWMAGLYPDAQTFFIMAAICVIVANIAISLGYAVSCICADVNIALSVAPFLVIPFMLFGGFYLNIDSVPVYFQWLGYLSYFKYAYEAVAINEWSHVPSIPGCANGTCPADGMEVLEMLHFPPDRIGPDIAILLAMMVGIRIIGFLGLLVRSYLKH